MSRITVAGNLVDEPELRYSQSGTAFARFTIAENRRARGGGDGEYEGHFIDVTAFGEVAENVAESAAKGDRVMVEGRWEQSKWQANDGSNRSKIQVLADEVGLSLRWAKARSLREPREERGPAPQPPSDEVPF